MRLDDMALRLLSLSASEFRQVQRFYRECCRRGINPDLVDCVVCDLVAKLQNGKHKRMRERASL